MKNIYELKTNFKRSIEDFKDMKRKFVMIMVVVFILLGLMACGSGGIYRERIARSRKSVYR